jgi:small subunit ribosomal protein S9
MSEVQTFYATGKRKTSIARVWLMPGSGSAVVNDRSLDEYFGGLNLLKARLQEPFEVTNTMGKYNLKITVVGGGLSSQADAMRHGVARALQKADPAMRAPLKKAGMLTRDAREVERKKYGRPGARKRFQYSKR